MRIFGPSQICTPVPRGIGVIVVLQHCPLLRDTAVCFHINNQTAVGCVTQQRSTWSENLLVTRRPGSSCHKRSLVLSAQYLLNNRLSGQTFILSRVVDSSVEWFFHPQAFYRLTRDLGDPRLAWLLL